MTDTKAYGTGHILVQMHERPDAHAFGARIKGKKFDTPEIVKFIALVFSNFNQENGQVCFCQGNNEVGVHVRLPSSLGKEELDTQVGLLRCILHDAGAIRNADIEYLDLVSPIIA